jgi:hypothetical protein
MPESAHAGWRRRLLPVQQLGGGALGLICSVRNVLFDGQDHLAVTLPFRARRWGRMRP